MQWNTSFEKEKIKNDEKHKNRPVPPLLRFLVLAVIIIGAVLTAGADFLLYQDSVETWHRLRYFQEQGVMVLAVVMDKEVVEECSCKTYYVDYVYEAPDATGRSKRFRHQITVDEGYYNTLVIGSRLWVTYDATDVEQSELSATVTQAQPPAGFFPQITLVFAGIIALILVPAWFGLVKRWQRYGV